MKNPWTIKESKVIYNNPWITLREDKVIDISNQPGIYGVVEFKNYALGIIPVDDQGNTYLVGQYRYPLDIYSWEIPMGGGLKTEDKLISAKRELEEETGITASEWQEIMTIHTSNSVTDEEGYIYLATGLSYGDSHPESCEDLQIKKLPLKDAVQMALKGDITDAISLSALLKLQLLLNSGELSL